MLNFFRDRLFLAVSSSHFAVDVLNGIGPVLMAVLATSLGLSNAQIALALTLYTFAGSLSQPGFGWLADRFSGRPTILAGVGAVWMAVCLAIMAFQTSWLLILPFFLLASFGSGLFHPIGTTSAAAAQRARAGSATSVFFFCGQIGLAMGPFLGGLLLNRSGSWGILPLCALALLPAALLFTAPAAPALPGGAGRKAANRLRVAAIIIAAFIVLVALRSTIQAAYTAFLPKLFADRGWQPSDYGALAGVFMFTAAIGNIITGELADRYGMRPAIFWPLLLGIPGGLMCLWAPTPPLAFIGSALAGLLIGGQHSVLVVHAQRLLPAQQGFAAGLILGFTFAAGGVGTWLAGWMADQVGLQLVMQIITLLAVPCAFLALTLPGRAPLNVAPAERPAATADGAAN